MVKRINRKERRRIEREKEKPNKKKKSNLKILAIPLILALTGTSIYYGTKKEDIQQPTNYTTIKSIPVFNIDSLFDETDRIVKDNNSSPLEKVISIIKVNAFSYNESLLKNNPSEKAAFNLYKKIMITSCDILQNKDPKLKSLLAEKKEINFRSVLKEYFRNHGYYFDAGDFKSDNNSNYRSFFLAKIKSEEETEIPLFSTGKTFKVKVLKYDDEIIPSFPIYKTERMHNKKVCYNFRTPSDSAEVVVGVCGCSDYSIKNTIIHEGTHSYIAAKNILKTPEEEKLHDETLAFLNEIMNGVNPQASLNVLCNEIDEIIPNTYKHAMTTICPCYKNIENMNEKDIRDTAMKIFEREYFKFFNK